MKKLIFLLLPLLMLSACATDEPQSSMTTDDQRVSTIPWNRPEKWEGKGQLGGMMGN